jgi:hypothetical protein
VGYPFKIMAMKPLGGGDFSLATPPATTNNKQQTITDHFHGGRIPRLIPF